MLAKRENHFRFCHSTLRKYVFEKPLIFFNILSTPHANNFIQELWDAATGECSYSDNLASNPDTFSIRTTLMGGKYPATVLTLPHPVMADEAHMIGVILTENSHGYNGVYVPEVRYFVLEASQPVNGGGYGNLCEWTAQGAYLKHGIPLPVDADAFLQGMEDRVIITSV